MADVTKLGSDLLSVLAKHGVAGLPQNVAAGPPAANPGSAAASYIKEIITGDQSFDEALLGRVATVLKTGSGG